MSHDEIIRMGLVDGVSALRSGKLSCADYCSAALAQADKFEGYNIFTQISPEYVRALPPSWIPREEKAGPWARFRVCPTP